MIDTRAEPVTPIPPVKQENLNAMFAQYLRDTTLEREKGHTNEAILAAVKTVADGLARYEIKNDRRVAAVEFRVDTLEEWRRQHRREHTESIPPMRDSMSTGQFNVELATLKAQQIAATQTVAAQIAAKEAEFQAYKESRLTEQNKELKEERKSIFGTILAVLGGIASIIGTAWATMWVASHTK